MPNFKIGTIQWSIGAFCLITGALMLVTPHHYNFLGIEGLKLFLPFLGIVSTIIGLLLVSLVILALKPTTAEIIHWLGGVYLGLIAFLFAYSGAWFGAVNFILLSLGLAFSLLLSRSKRRGSDSNPINFFPLLMGFAALVSGLLLLRSGMGLVRYLDLDNHPLHTAFGLAFLAGGVLLIFLYLAWSRYSVSSKIVVENNPLARISTLLQLYLGVLFLLFMVHTISQHKMWVIGAYFWTFGGTLLFLPWLGKQIKLPPASSVHARLALLLSVTTVIPLILTVALITEREEQIVRAEVLVQQQDQAELISNDLGEYIGTRQAALLGLARRRGLMEQSVENQREHIHMFSQLFPDLSYFALYDADGNLIVDSRERLRAAPPAARSVSGYPVFEDAKSSRLPTIEIVDLPGYPFSVLWFGAPVVSNGEFEGLLTFELTSPQLNDFIARIDQYVPGIIYLVDAQGHAIAHPRRSFVSSRVDLSSSPSVLAFLANEGNGSLQYWAGNDQVLAGYTRDRVSGWGVITERMAATDALAGVYAGRDTAFIALAFFFLLSILLGFIISGRITRRLRALSLAAQELSAGNFKAPLPRSSILELGYLASAFSEMRDQLAEKIRDQMRVEEQLRQAKQELELRVVERTEELSRTNAALSTLNQRLQTILDTAPAGIWIAEASGKIIQKNHMVDLIWGEDAPLLDKIEEYGEYKGWWADSGDPVKAGDWAIARALTQGEITVGEVIDIERFDGKTGTILSAAAPIHNEEGIISGAVAIAQDITFQRQLEQQARQQAEKLEGLLEENRRNRELLEAIFANEPGGLAVLVGEGLEFKLVNPAYRKLTPSPSMDPVGRKYDEVWPKDNGLRIKSLLKQVMETGESIHTSRHTMVDPEGSIRYFAMHLSLMNWNGTPAVLSVFWETSSLEYAQRSAEKSAAEAQERATQLAFEQARLQAVLEHAPAGVVMANSEGNLTLVNPAANAMLGGRVTGDMYSPSGRYSLHKPDGSLFAPQDLPLPVALHSKKAVEGVEILVRHESGEQSMLLVNATPVLDAEGRIAGAVAVMQDITERKRAEGHSQFLVYISDFLSQVSDPGELIEGVVKRLAEFLNVEHSLLSTFSENGAVTEVQETQALAEEYVWLSGFPIDILKELIAGTTIVVNDSRLDPRTAGFYNEYFAPNGLRAFVMVPQLRSGAMAAVLCTGSINVREWHKDEVILIQMVANRLWLAFENAKLMANLKHSEERFRTSVDNLLDGFAILSSVRAAGPEEQPGEIIDFEYVYINEAGCHLNQRTFEEQVGRSLLELLPGHKETGLFKDYVHLVESGEPIIKDTLYYEDIYGGGQKLSRIYEMRAVRLGDGFALTWRDVTERRIMENTLENYAAQLERSNRELEQFAFVASHDLQEPLRKVKVFSEMLINKASQKLSGDEQDYLHRMQNAVERMQSMIQDLLAYSRVTTKGQPFNQVDLNKVTKEVVSDLEIRISRSGGKVEIGELPVIEADPLQMRQLIQNLLGNGLKFHKDGLPPYVKICSCPAEEVGTVRIAVEDNGIGFDLQNVERIFQPFERLHGMSRYEGTGMGLAICDKIVKRHHGKIQALSEPGKGATFIITLPVRQPVNK